MLGSDFSHLLVHGNHVPIRRTKLATSQPNGNTIVMMAQCPGVMATNTILHEKSLKRLLSLC